MSWCCITFDFEVSCWANCLPLAVKWPETWKAPRHVKSPNPPCLRPPAKWSRWMIMRHLLQHLMIWLCRFVYPFHVFLNHWNLQFLDVFMMCFFSFFERGTGIQRLGRGGISCHGNPRCTCFSLKTGQLVIMTTMMKQVRLGLRVLEIVKSVNQEALDIVQRVCHKGHIMDHLSLHRWYVHDCSQLGLGVQLASWDFTLMKLGNL